MDINILVVIAYIGFLIAITLSFRSFNRNTSDYFSGGGKVLWWMVGATAFMTQFSAWTFTGAASKAFNDGFAIVVLYLANAVGYLTNYLYFAPRFRQMRVVTATEALRSRFGRTSEQSFVWISMLDGLLSAGQWLNGLAIITGAVFHLPVGTVIVATGLVVIAMALAGGAWVMVASDYLQMLIVMAVTFTCAIVALGNAGGITPIVDSFHDSFWIGHGYAYAGLFALWVVMIVVKQIFMMNNGLNSYRYICAKDSQHARKGALLTCVLSIVGPLIWFVPAWFMHYRMPDFASDFGMLGHDAREAVFVAFVSKFMPAGMLGLLMAAMFAASMSAMDAGINRNAGFFVRNFYRTVLRPQATEKELMVASKFASLVFGLLVVGVGIVINSVHGMTLFDILVTLSAMVTFPLAVPAMLGFVVRKTPDWSGWATLLVGLVVSYIFGMLIGQTTIESWFGLKLSGREWADLRVSIVLLAHVVITGGFFVSTRLFYSETGQQRAAERADLFRCWDTPVESDDSDEADDARERRQRGLLGRLVCLAALGIMALSLLPNALHGRIVFLICGAILLLPGAGLVHSADRRSGRRTQRAADNKDSITQSHT
ncbi:transporter (plasmid) [Burkholderia sp. MSMB0856]|uniref:sodium:solute symporter family transporter n=1 Tax=Burkholderia sp. MSMB0856 TaxID=1637869 RepID=UPI0008586468|nr:transporter [Burkholderia sp. MSMB0856]AOJ85258.1 transporter [Burkholderia sp. MSMB0856]